MKVGAIQGSERFSRTMLVVQERSADYADTLDVF